MYIYIYIYIYISIYIYILQKRTQCSAFFCKRTKHSRVLLCSLQKNETFSAFFYILCKKNVAFSAFFYVLKKRMHRSFGSHKSPKT